MTRKMECWQINQLPLVISTCSRCSLCSLEKGRDALWLRHIADDQNEILTEFLTFAR